MDGKLERQGSTGDRRDRALPRGQLPPPVYRRLKMILAVTRLDGMPDCLYEAGGRCVRDEVPGESLQRVCAHRQQESDCFPRYRPRHSARPVTPVLRARLRLRPRRPNVSIKLRRQVREGARPARPAEMTNGELPVPIRPFQRRRLRNVRQDGPSVHPLKYIRASKPFQVPHNRKRALAPFDDTPKPRPYTHHHRRPERRVRFLHLGCQFQPRISLPY